MASLHKMEHDARRVRPRAVDETLPRRMDPGRLAQVNTHQVGSPGWRFALQFRDWLRAEPDALADYARAKRRLLATSSSTTESVAAKEP